MALKVVESRLRYLRNASESLFTSSPTVSAHLQTVRHAVAEGKGYGAASQQSKRDCTSCGSILVPGWSCKSVKEATAKRTRKDRLVPKQPGLKVIRRQCSKCDAVTTIETAKPKRDRKAQTSPSRPFPAAHQDRKSDKLPASPQPTFTPERTPRRRAKNKRSSLQSMLANQKKTGDKEPTGFGLDLMDFAKT